MFTNLTYHQKIKLLGLSIIPLAFICYKLSIAKTIDEYLLYNKNKQLTEQIDSENSSDKQSKNKLSAITNLIEAYQLDTIDFSKNLLSVVSSYCKYNPVILKEYKPIVIGSDSLPLFTRLMTIEGGYIDCLKLVHLLETKFKTGRVSSVAFKSYTDPQKEHTHLDCSIYIQNIINFSYEKE